MSEMTAAVPAIAVRCITGVLLLDGPESYAERSAPRDNSKACRSILFSPKGQYLAWSNGTTIEVVRCSDWSQVCSISRPKSVELQFSPQGSYLVSWELYASNKDTPEGTANMYVYKVEDGSLVQSFIQKRQIGWQPCWSSDEKLLGRLVNTDIVVYDEAPFTQASARLNCAKVASFSMSPTPAQRCYIACHMPSVSNGPLFGKLFQYPKFEMTQAVASKAFFQGDAIHYHWNSTGTCVLLMTSTEVDKTGATYYGRQTLSFASTRGDTSLVQLSKEGPIYDVAWSPKGTEFCVVYGMMPSKATLFDIKCNPIFEFGTVARNSVFFSPNGSRLLLAGFGNLPGRVEVWDTESRRQLAAADAPDTTGITWDPRSECFLTYTCAPRLRTDNGFKVWHSSGSLMHEVRWPAGQELRELCWQPGSFPASGLATKKPKAVAPFKAAASGKPYRPPSSKGVEAFKLNDAVDRPHKPGQNSLGDGAPSKAALKQKKKREARKAKKALEQAEQPEPAALPLTAASQQAPPANQASVVQQARQASPPSQESVGGGSNGGEVTASKRKTKGQDPEKDKKIKNIIKKLEAIAKLKVERAEGKPLDLNQLNKMAKENDLLRELGELNL